jgi:hypothetical protein
MKMTKMKNKKHEEIKDKEDLSDYPVFVFYGTDDYAMTKMETLEKAQAAVKSLLDRQAKRGIII